jgi:hydroxyacylglutathione hydrolase
MELVALPAFEDNYIWMLCQGQQAVVVDPGDAAPVQRALQARNLTLAGILVTHHHPDHVGGLPQLVPQLQGPIYGPRGEQSRISTPFEALGEGDVVNLLGAQFRVMDVPGHTAGHIAYAQLGAPSRPILFCGDTLFSAGCGRLFEGTPAQMHDSLSRLAALPGDSQVCCTHEYTLSNLKFALAVEPDNSDLQAHQAWALAQRGAGLMTLPSSLSLELAINPFLRCHQEPVVARALASAGARSSASADVFAALRAWKDKFR